MVPVKFFTQFAQACADRPFLLLSKKQQVECLAEIKKIVSALHASLEQKQLQRTHAYKIVQVMGQAIENGNLDEARFAEALAQLDTLYGSKTKPDFLAEVKQLDTFAERFKKRAQEFQILENRIAQAITSLTQKQINEHDKKILNDIGLFYVLEYTLILEQEMREVDAAQQAHVLDHGIKVGSGNLPGLRPLMDSMRQEFAFQIYDTKLRWNILSIFYDFKTVLDTNDISSILSGLRAFNIELLRTFILGGVQNFTGVVYKPYPDNTPLTDIIKNL